MVAGLNSARGDRFAAGFTRTGRWQPYTQTVAPPGVIGRRKITQLAVLSIGSEVEWRLSQLASHRPRRVHRARRRHGARPARGRRLDEGAGGLRDRARPLLGSARR